MILSCRPGINLYVINMVDGTLEALVEAGEDFHFYGHGVFSQDGRRFYATANHYPSGEGYIRVYAADDGYRHLQDFPVAGMGPHELRLHPDGQRLVVTMGGIQTHPDYGRFKLNLESMKPALVVMDRHDGTILQRCEPSHHQFSCHHLEISSDDVVIAGYQFEGPKWETPPLIARLDTETGACPLRSRRTWATIPRVSRSVGILPWRRLPRRGESAWYCWIIVPPSRCT